MGNQLIKMKYTTLIAVVALFAASNVEQVSAVHLERKKKKEDPPPTAADTPTSGYFGADEDDVMNNIFNHYAVEVTNEAGSKMEAYMAEFFPRTWAKFDLNNAGEIDITESHTFMRSLMGRLNQFVLAPGSLTDIKVE